MARILVPLVSMLLVACDRTPQSYPPPEQRAPFEQRASPGQRIPLSLVEPPAGSMLVNMNDLGAPAYFVKDISAKLEGETWRWTQKRPTLKILIVKTRGLTFVTDFTVWEGTMKQTGPVTISFFIDGKLLDKVRYDTPGYKHFEKAVDPAWLQTATETVVAAEIDKLYVDPVDKTQLGFILTRMGFERR